jgi:4-amino-4-deoxy-L-arabinose transferase-like glycosyltransferase
MSSSMTIPTPATVTANSRVNGRSGAGVASRHVELAFLLLFGLVCRGLAMLLVVKQHPPAWLFTRGTEMGLLATSVLHGEGLSSPLGGHTGPSALIGPVYPLMLAAIFHIAGSYTLAAEIAVLSIQVLVGLINIWLIVRIGAELAGRQTAFLAGMLWACSPPLIFMPTILWDTTFTTCALTAILALSLRFQKNPSSRFLLWLGFLFGLASLLNSALFFTSLAVLGWLASRLPATRLRTFLLSIAVFTGVYSPWPIRNAFAMHAFVPFRSTVGLELWMGNHEGSTGHLEEKLFPLFNADEFAKYQSLGELRYNRQKTAIATAYIESHPVVFVHLTARRILRYWLGTGSREGSPWLSLHTILTTTLGLAGLVTLAVRKNWRTLLPFLLPMLLFPLPYYITHAEFRYRLVVDPLLTVLAACAIAALVQRFARSTPREEAAS